MTGIGNLKDDSAKLHINDSVTPAVQPHQRIPFHIRKKLEQELVKLQELDNYRASWWNSNYMGVSCSCGQ